MAKIKLGNRPKSFKKVIKVPMIDGSEGSIECVFTYRTRTEFGAFIDEITEAAGIKAKTDEDQKFSLKELMEKTKDSSADYIMKVVEGWNLDEDFTRQNVQQLCDEFPGVAAAIMESYRTATTEGRLGN